MPQSIIQVKEQDSAKERARLINDISKMLVNRIAKLETDLKTAQEEIELLKDSDLN